MKRVTCKRNYPTNELLMRFLKEMKEAEKSRNEASRMIFTYRHAWNSLKVFPLEIKDADDLRTLKYFGDVLVKKLSKMLEEFRRQYGEPSYELLEQVYQIVAPPVALVTTTTSNLDKVKNVSTKPKKKSNDKEFMPLKGSGSYAILRALHDDAVFNGGYERGSLFLEDLRKASDTYCREAMVKNSALQHYTPFSCLTTLTKKGLVKRQKVGRKDVVALTGDGFQLAEKLSNQNDDEEPPPLKQKTPASKIVSINVKEKIKKTTKRVADKSDADAVNVKNSKLSPPLLIDSTDASRNDVKERRIKETINAFYQDGLSDDDVDDVILPLSERLKRKQPKSTSHLNSFSTGFPSDKKETSVVVPDLDDLPGPSWMNSNIERAVEKEKGSISATTPTFKNFGFVYVSSELVEKRNKFEACREFDQSLGVEIVWIKTTERYLLAQKDFLYTLSPNVGIFEVPYVLAYLYEMDGADVCPGFYDVGGDVESEFGSATVGSGNKIQQVLCCNSSTVAKNTTVSKRVAKSVPTNNFLDKCIVADDNFALESNSFDVILIVDCAETKGGVAMTGEKDANRRDLLTEYLKEKGLLFETRKLSVGDYLWIARKRHDRTCPELVLDIIIERKRMDDLARSIQDGRWKSQKFRLKRCGLRKVIYLFEALPKSMVQPAFNPAALRSAMINVEIQDNFSVEKTLHLKDTVDFIARMTKFLIRHFKSKRLTSKRFINDDVPESDGILDLDSSSPSLLRFDEFQTLAEKPRRFTVGETFTLCLSQISGVSMELAKGISNKFGTLQALMDAYQECGDDEKAKINLLQDITSGAQSRRLGPKLAKKIANFFCSHNDGDV